MEKIRTLGFYQPYGSLMIHGKTETRWVRENKKPPFPLGKYLLYTTQKEATDEMVDEWSSSCKIHIINTLSGDDIFNLNGYAICIGELVNLDPLTIHDTKTFVDFVGRKTEIIKDVSITKIQWGLYFQNVQKIKPFKWNFGKQGVGFVPESELEKIILL